MIAGHHGLGGLKGHFPRCISKRNCFKTFQQHLTALVHFSKENGADYFFSGVIGSCIKHLPVLTSSVPKIIQTLKKKNWYLYNINVDQIGLFRQEPNLKNMSNSIGLMVKQFLEQIQAVLNDNLLGQMTHTSRLQFSTLILTVPLPPTQNQNCLKASTSQQCKKLSPECLCNISRSQSNEDHGGTCILIKDPIYTQILLRLA